MRLLLAICGIAMLSCNNNSVTAPTENENIAVKTPSQDSVIAIERIEGCYIRILKRDTMLLHLQQNGNAVSGKMNFDNYEKDGSTGTVSGLIEDGLVKLWYHFQSEGMNSVMELYFKIDDASMLHGIGPMDSKGDTAYFTDHSKIAYSKDQSLNKIDCAQVPEKYL